MMGIPRRSTHDRDITVGVSTARSDKWIVCPLAALRAYRTTRLVAMQPLDASAVSKLLRELGQRTAMGGGNPYRGKAYTRAADSLLALTIPLRDVIAQGRLRDVPGVGEAISDIITRLHRTGTHPSLERIRADVPEGVLDMLSIPGLRPEKVLKLHRELGVSSPQELEQAAHAGAIAKTKGLGPALEKKVLQGIEVRRTGSGHLHLHRAAALLESAERQLRGSHSEITRVTAAGELRRGCELVRDLSLVAEIKPGKRGQQSLAPTEQLTVKVTDREHYGITLLRATGSDAHWKALQEFARSRGMALDENGVGKGRRVLARHTEEEIYAALGLPWIAPELREDGQEITRALSGSLPDLVCDQDLRGILHVHTDRSEGADRLARMAEATQSRGYQYLGVADHSQSAHYAGGLKVQDIADQHAEIGRLNRQFGGRFRIFRGIESDIRVDGSLDYPDEVLAQFDFIVASVHSRFNLDQKAQTDRIIRAVEIPYTTILGHMTGRQLLRRPGYEVDVEEILKACAAFGVAVEINANPWRLDLDWRWHERALELGCFLSVNPDAHSTRELDHTHWGVEMTRKGGVPKERVLNAFTLRRITEHFRKRRRAQLKAA